MRVLRLRDGLAAANYNREPIGHSSQFDCERRVFLVGEASPFGYCLDRRVWNEQHLDGAFPKARIDKIGQTITKISDGWKLAHHRQWRCDA